MVLKFHSHINIYYFQYGQRRKYEGEVSVMFTFIINSKHFPIFWVANGQPGFLQIETALIFSVNINVFAVETWRFKSTNKVILILGSNLRLALFRNIFYTKFPLVPFHPVNKRRTRFLNE